MRIIIVTGADHGFFEHLQGLLLSLNRFEQRQGVSLAVLDFGLSPEQVQWLRPWVDYVDKPTASLLRLPADMAQIPVNLTASEKLSLRERFPGFDIYLWVDADIWFQSWTALQLMIEVAAQGKMGIVPERDRCYDIEDDLKAVEWRFERYKQLVKPNIAQSLAICPYVNTGIFSLPANGKHWQLWQDYYLRCIAGKFHTGIAQTVINYLLLSKQLEYVPLPASCNWVCHLALPIWHPEQKCFVEPLPPHAPISALHLTATTKHMKELRYAYMASRHRS